MQGGVKTGQFWVSAGPETQGVNGSMIMLMDGQDSNVFVIANRLINFTVVNPSPMEPFIVNYGFSAIGSTTATFTITASASFTFYFFIGPTCVEPVSFETILLK